AHPVPPGRRQRKLRPGKALGNNPQLLLVRPAPPRPDLDNLERCNLRTSRMISHTTSSSPQLSDLKAAFAGRVLFARKSLRSTRSPIGKGKPPSAASAPPREIRQQRKPRASGYRTRGVRELQCEARLVRQKRVHPALLPGPLARTNSPSMEEERKSFR